MKFCVYDVFINARSKQIAGYFIMYCKKKKSNNKNNFLLNCIAKSTRNIAGDKLLLLVFVQYIIYEHFLNQISINTVKYCILNRITTHTRK